MEVPCLGGELWKLRSSILGEEDDCVAVNHQEEDEVVAMNMIEAEASPVIVLGQDQIDLMGLPHKLGLCLLVGPILLLTFSRSLFQNESNSSSQLQFFELMGKLLFNHLGRLWMRVLLSGNQA